MKINSEVQSLIEEIIDCQQVRGVDRESMLYMRLWRSVIAQSIIDIANRSSGRRCKGNRIRALRWIRESSEDFVEVCQRAGLDAAYVRSKIQQWLVSRGKRQSIELAIKVHKYFEPIPYNFIDKDNIHEEIQAE